MNNLGGHDSKTILDALHSVKHDKPTCFIAYTIKGFGLPFAGHKDNHSGLMTPAQMDTFRAANKVRPGHEWDKFEGMPIPPERLQEFLKGVPRAQAAERQQKTPPIPVPDTLAVTVQPVMSTQTGFGAILNEIGRGDDEFASRIVTASPDVTVSTNLGPWVNRRGLFAREALADTFKSEQIPSTFNWEFSPKGQHIELGIAEANLFILLSALGLSHVINGVRLLPVGTLYDPFIARGLDQLNYACYQDARFMVVATPSGITLAPEGGAHQSVSEPLIGLAQDGLATLRAGLCRRTRRHHALGLRLHAEKRRRGVRAELAARRDRRLGLSAAVDAAGRADPARDDRRAAPGRSSMAPIGSASRGRTRRSSSPIPAPSRRRRSRRSA